MESTDTVDDSKKLSELFDDAWRIYRQVEESNTPTASEEQQQLIKSAADTVATVELTVRQLSLFSRNEELSETPTADLRYLLLPALAAALTVKLSTPDRDARLAALGHAVALHERFLQQCHDYGAGPAHEVERALAGVQDRGGFMDFAPSGGDLKAMTEARDRKVAKYRAAKERDAQLTKLRDADDDNQARQYWLLLLDKWIDVSIDELAGLRSEQRMLEQMKGLSRDDVRPVTTSTVLPNGGKPFMLTRNKLQAQVFGAGYPSLPTMTLDEYFDREVAAGRMPDQGHAGQGDGGGRNPDEEEDSDSDEKVEKQRRFDDWKDTHRRGDGNRMNKG